MFDLTNPVRALAFVSALAIAAAAQAQTTSTDGTTTAPATTEAPAADAPAADPAAPSAATPAKDGPGATYTKEAFDAWELNCIKVKEGKEPCQLYQLLKDDKGNSTAEISLMPLPDGQEAAAGATIITPLETLLTAHLTIQIDTADAKVYPFTFCTAIGCVARIGFTSAEIDALKKGAKATMTIVPVAAPDKKVPLDISLKGFTAGFDAVKKYAAE